MTRATVAVWDGAELLFESNGPVPRALGLGGGDYVELKVDAATGRIVGWKPITLETLEELRSCRG